MASHETFIATERERLTKEKADLTAQMETVKASLIRIEREFRAIEAYETIKAGKDIPTPRTSAPRGSYRETVLSLLATHKSLKPNQIKDKLGDQAPKGLYNLLNNLKKQGKVKEKDGKYDLA